MRRLLFASSYVYSPVGAGLVSQHSRALRAVLKRADREFLGRFASRVRSQVEQCAELAALFAEPTVLVPVPGSEPLAPGMRSVADVLAHALLEAGLGACVSACMRRARAVPKSATAPGGRRPTVGRHLESFALDVPLLLAAMSAPSAAPPQILMIDDVVTKGRTLLAAASRVQECLPNASIRAFALLRTMGLVADVVRLADPCVGWIRWRAGDAERSP
jgi:hypothetical protein